MSPHASPSPTAEDGEALDLSRHRPSGHTTDIDTRRRRTHITTAQVSPFGTHLSRAPALSNENLRPVCAASIEGAADLPRDIASAARTNRLSAQAMRVVSSLPGPTKSLSARLSMVLHFECGLTLCCSLTASTRDQSVANSKTAHSFVTSWNYSRAARVLASAKSASTLTWLDLRVRSIDECLSKDSQAHLKLSIPAAVCRVFARNRIHDPKTRARPGFTLLARSHDQRPKSTVLASRVTDQGHRRQQRQHSKTVSVLDLLTSLSNHIPH